MWLKRILKNSATGPSGGGGGDLGVAGDNVMGIDSGQGALFQGESSETQEKMYNAQKRRQKRKRIERHRKWRLSKDQQ